MSVQSAGNLDHSFSNLDCLEERGLEQKTLNEEKNSFPSKTAKTFPRQLQYTNTINVSLSISQCSAKLIQFRSGSNKLGTLIPQTLIHANLRQKE